jgi:hypothetical protein
MNGPGDRVIEMRALTQRYGDSIVAIGIGILYALVIEGLLSAFADSVAVLEPLTNVFVRAHGYSIATALGASPQDIESSGPGSFSGPLLDSPQALAVLAAISALLLRRRDSRAILRLGGTRRRRDDPEAVRGSAGTGEVARSRHC